MLTTIFLGVTQISFRPCHDDKTLSKYKSGAASSLQAAVGNDKSITTVTNMSAADIKTTFSFGSDS